MIFFLVLGLWPSFRLIRRRRPFPIPSRKFAPRCKESLEPAYRAGGCYVFGLVSRDESHYEWHCLGFCSGEATPLAEMGKWQVSSSSRIAPERRQVRCGDRPRGQFLMVGQSEERQRVVGMLGRAAAAEFDVPGERRRSVIRVERRRR